MDFEQTWYAAGKHFSALEVINFEPRRRPQKWQNFRLKIEPVVMLKLSYPILHNNPPVLGESFQSFNHPN